jgi:hypothetical protein
MSDSNHPEDSEARQFDFWLGNWDCTWGDGERAVNRVTAILNGCVIQETFDASPDLRGLSLSVYNKVQQVWQQTWVDDSGSYWAFRGIFRNGEMCLATDDLLPDGRVVQRRMTWYNIGPQEFDWRWDKSEDGGATWLTQWQVHYRRREG